MSSRIAMVGCHEQQSKTTKRKFYFLALRMLLFLGLMTNSEIFSYLNSI